MYEEEKSHLKCKEQQMYRIFVRSGKSVFIFESLLDIIMQSTNVENKHFYFYICLYFSHKASRLQSKCQVVDLEIKVVLFWVELSLAVYQAHSDITHSLCLRSLSAPSHQLGFRRAMNNIHLEMTKTSNNRQTRYDKFYAMVS